MSERPALHVTFDHVGILVRDLDRAAQRLERLGFTLTAAAAHAADGDRPGSVQRSVMFRTGYLEIQEIADLHGPHPLAPAARRHFGAHILAFGVDDPEAARDGVLARGVSAGPVLRWSRPVAEAGADARFTFFAAAYDPPDAAFLCWVRHETPETLRPPQTLQHANGAVRLDGVVIATDGPVAALVARYVACGGIDAGGGTVRMHGGTVAIRRRETLPDPVATADWPAAPFIAIVRMTAADPDALTARAAGDGLMVHGVDAGRLIDLRADLGCWVEVRTEN
jgi:catechol 2,3-dioxygenase-like lactoylglutathione lyase family enzyme